MTRLAVEYAELAALATALRWQAGEIDDHARMLTGSAASGDIAQATILAPVEAAAAETAILHAATKAGLMLLELEARALATDVAADLYKRADEVAEAGLDAAEAARDWAEKEWARLESEARRWAYEDALPWLIDTGLDVAIVGLEGLLFYGAGDVLGAPGVAALSLLTGGHWPTTSHEEAAAGLLALLDHFGYDLDPDLHHDALVPNADFQKEKVVLGSLMDYENTSYNKQSDGKNDPQVVITRIEGSPPHYIVNIPGTDPNALVGDTSTGLGSDLATMADAATGRQSELSKEVIEVLRDAHLPADAQVLLSGHSLGGMVAASIASDPGLVDEFHVKAIATQGSPIAHYPVDSSVSVLAVEHNQDVVPQLDGANNPHAANWHTVMDDDPERARNPLDAHDGGHYKETLEAHRTDATVQAWQQQNAAFFGTAVSQTTSHVYQGAH